MQRIPLEGDPGPLEDLLLVAGPVIGLIVLALMAYSVCTVL